MGQGALAAAALHTDFDLDQVAPWPNGAEVPFSYLAAAFEAIGKDSRRLAKTQQLVALFRGIIARTPEDLLPTVYLCTNQVAPAHTGIELGIGDAILIKVPALGSWVFSFCGQCTIPPSDLATFCNDVVPVLAGAEGGQNSSYQHCPQY